MSHDEDAELDWLPEEGVALAHDDLVRIMKSLKSLKALVAGRARDDIDRVHVLDILRTLERAIERQGGDR